VRRLISMVAVAAVAGALGGCTTPPLYTPSDDRVVSARAAAAAQAVDVGELVLESGMRSVGDHTVDACGTARSSSGFGDTGDMGLRCTLTSVAVFALDGAATAADAAAVVDGFVTGNGARSITTMTAEVAAATAADAQFALPPGIGATVGDAGAGFAVKLFDTAQLDGSLQHLPVRAGGLVQSDEGDWPDDVEGAARSTGALYFAVIETSVEYYDSSIPLPTSGTSELGEQNPQPPCYGTSGHCPGG